MRTWLGEVWPLYVNELMGSGKWKRSREDGGVGERAGGGGGGARSGNRVGRAVEPGLGSVFFSSSSFFSKQSVVRD